MIEEISPHIGAAFKCSWEQRFRTTPGGDEENHPGGRTCNWLYHNLTIDGAARIMPCCMAPDKRDKRLVFHKLTTTPSSLPDDAVNSSMARSARLAFGNRLQYEE
jgi:hypothetical protein